jgi:hypothetical protein
MRKPTATDLLTAVQQALVPQGRPGPDWYTTDELTVNGRSRHATVRLIAEWMKQGKVERRSGVLNGKRMVFYREVKP